MQARLSLLFFPWCLSRVDGARMTNQAQTSVHNSSNATAGMDIDFAGKPDRKSYTCCCKQVDDPETQCNRDERPGGQLRFYHGSSKRCCKKVDSAFGCMFQSRDGKYSKHSMYPWCDADESVYEESMCCDTGDGAFFVKKTIRYAVHTADPYYTFSRVHISDEYIDGATYDGTYHSAPAVIEHLRGTYGSADRVLECQDLRRTKSANKDEDEVCEISTKKPDKCCCKESDHWSGYECLDVAERPLPQIVKQAGADWEVVNAQTYTQCAETKVFDVVRQVPYQESYQSTCKETTKKWKVTFVHPTMSRGRWEYSTRNYRCTKHRTNYKSVPGTETRCVRNEEIPFCKDGQSLYLRQVPLGVCRDKTTLIPERNFGQMRCPDDEVPYGTSAPWEARPGETELLKAHSGICKCSTRCDK